MNNFVSFCDYADELIVDGEAEDIVNMPEVGDYVSWIDRSLGRQMAKVAFITPRPDELVVKMGRVMPANLDITNAVQLFSHNQDVLVIKK
jgi:hypothetical protein